jgi:6-pyruvoyltetrahydropterin/6-carboxytetrahydropterin synthase
MHRYENPAWDEQKNREIFGACFTPHGHGHTYKLEVCVSGPVAPETGMVINLKELDESIKAVVAKVSGKHLNFEVDEFKNKIPTTENLLLYLFGHMKEKLGSRVRLEKMRLYENENLWADHFAEGVQ